MRRFVWGFVIAIMGWSMLPVGAQDYGANWTISYYNSTDASGVAVGAQFVQRIDFDYANTAVPAGIDKDLFSFVAVSNVSFDEGTYRFTVGADDGARLTIDGVVLLDSFSNRGSYTTNTAEAYLPAGFHAIQLNYVQMGGDAKVVIYWEKVSDANLADTGTTDAPAAPPQPTAIPAPAGQVATGEVLYAKGLSVRSGPYLGASRVKTIAPGTSYPVFASNRDEGEFTWYYIEVQEYLSVLDDTTQTVIRQPFGNPVRGWVSGRYFFLDDRNAIVPAMSTPFEALSTNAQPSTGIAGETTSNLRVRTRPSYRTPTVTILDWGADVEILARTEQAGEPHWFLVQYDGGTGWVFAPFVRFDGNLATVPLY